MAAANTDKFRKSKARYSSTIAAPGVASDSATTIPLSDATGLPTDTAIDLTINRVNSAGVKQANWETTTVVISGSNGTNAIRAVAGTASAWPAGTVVECLVTADAQNDMVDGLLEEHAQDGKHSDINVTSINSTGDITFADGKGIVGKTTGGTSKTILALETDVTYVGNSSQATKHRGTTHEFWDANGNEVLKTAAGVTSAVNEITVTNAATGNAPSIAATGGDTHIGLKLATKGNESLRIPVYEQGGNGTNTMRQNQVIQRGWGFIVGDGDAEQEKAVTFPVAYDDALVDVQITYLGAKNNSDPSTRVDAATVFTAGRFMVKEGSITTTGFSAKFALSTGTVANTYRNLFSWIAIGTKA